jgi:hypothetical protein
VEILGQHGIAAPMLARYAAEPKPYRARIMERHEVRAAEADARKERIAEALRKLDEEEAKGGKDDFAKEEIAGERAELQRQLRDAEGIAQELGAEHGRRASIAQLRTDAEIAEALHVIDAYVIEQKQRAERRKGEIRSAYGLQVRQLEQHWASQARDWVRSANQKKTAKDAEETSAM